MLSWKEWYILLALKALEDKRYDNVNQLYKKIGLDKRVSTKLIHGLHNNGYIKWQPRNRDGKYYVILEKSYDYL